MLRRGIIRCYRFDGPVHDNLADWRGLFVLGIGLSVLVPFTRTTGDKGFREAKQSTRARAWTDIIAYIRGWQCGLVTLREHSVMQFFVMVGTQRTGTNLLRELLATNPEISCRGEVFSPVPGEDEFEQYLKRNNLARPHDYPEAERQLKGYLREIHRSLDRGTKVYGVDIKYSQLRAIAPYFESLSAVPVLVQYLLKGTSKIIHVVRDNVLQAALSEVIARQRQVFHHREAQSVTQKFEIDCRDLIRVMQEKRADRAIFASLMEGYGRIITCEYERTVRGLTMADAMGNLVGNDNPIFEIADFLGVQRKFRRPETLHKVIQSPYRDLISNYDQVVKAVGRTEFATYLDTI
jgi:LPS sulfotransferase NodH